ncbi:MAG: fimbrillin family protein, partial [Tannerella sp.]|nr:fimbrillin family protein [Tannerella sp.]
MKENRITPKDVTCYVFAAIALIEMALAACTDTQDIVAERNPQETVPAEGSIVFRALPAQTRTTDIDANNLSSFRIGILEEGDTPTVDSLFTYASPFNVVKNNSAWNYAPPVYWPEDEGKKLSFYAYAPAGSVNLDYFASKPAAEGTDSAIISYTVPTNSIGTKKAEDFLIAKKSQTEAEGRTVQLDFLHALSMARFAAENQSSSLSFVINSIELLNLYNQGRLDLSPVSDTADVYWTPAGRNEQTYMPALPPGGLSLAPGSGLTGLTSANEDLPVLPQVVALQDNGRAFDLSQPALRVVYSTVSSDGKTVADHDTALFSFPGTFPKGQTRGKPSYPQTDGQFVFQMGRRYTFNFAFTPGEQILFDLGNVPGWDDSPTEKPQTSEVHNGIWDANDLRAFKDSVEKGSWNYW